MGNKSTAIVYIITKLELGGAQKVCLSLLDGVENLDFKTYLITGKEGVLVDSVKNKTNIIYLNNLKREISIRAVINEIKSFFELVRNIKNKKRTCKYNCTHT